MTKKCHDPKIESSTRDPRLDPPLSAEGAKKHVFGQLGASATRLRCPRVRPAPKQKSLEGRAKNKQKIKINISGILEIQKARKTTKCFKKRQKCTKK